MLFRSPDANAQATIRQAVLDVAPGAQDPYWRAQLVSKLYSIGAVEDGIKLAEESARMFPQDLSLWHLVAIAYEQTGRARQAIPWREATVRMDPLNTDFKKSLAQDKVAKA